MADITRVTPPRTRLALVLGFLSLLLAALPATARASRIVVQRDPGLSAAERADVRADAGVRFAESLDLPDAEVVTVPAAGADRALAALNADPDVRFAAADVTVR